MKKFLLAGGANPRIKTINPKPNTIHALYALFTTSIHPPNTLHAALMQAPGTLCAGFVKAL